MIRKLMVTLMVLALPVLASAQVDDDGKPVKIVTDGDIGALNYWSSDTVYNIQGFVFVEDGEVLIIEAGTIVKGNQGQAENATALIVARGGKIYAEGTQNKPIIFTTIIDDVGTVDAFESTDPVGQWGGVIVLGAARTNDGVDNIEGLPVSARSEYGGADDLDNSGIIKYVSIRHGGSNIGANNEINGLTMGGVGRGTTISHVEVIFNQDDGFEWFGGTVHCTHLVAAYCGDDFFDMDEGLSVTGQFWFAITDRVSGDKMGEHDGDDVTLATPYASAVVTNATYIGDGADIASDPAFAARANFGGAYFNSIFAETQCGLSIGDANTAANLAAEDLYFANNLWGPFFDGTTIAGAACGDAATEAALLAAPGNVVQATTFAGLDTLRTTNNALDPRPTNVPGGFVWLDPNDPVDGYQPTNVNIDYLPSTYEAVDYPGAFDPNAAQLWICGWTALDSYGYLADECAKTLCDCAVEGDKPVVAFTDADMVGFRVLSRDTIWNLQGFVYVDPGEVLLIEPGTILKGNEGSAENATALVVSRGGKLYALGSCDCPIIMTSISDNDVTDWQDGVDVVNGNPVGRWGGLIVLGAARTNDGTDNIEGLPVSARSEYGGVDDQDNSGVVKYVSIRHGGSNIGANNEINGLTMGGVGRGTVINHVEVLYNQDDGFEWFGGSVQCDYLVAAFCGDDHFDMDEGLTVAGQFWFGVQQPNDGDKMGEHDGDDVTLATPYASPLVSNATYVGRLAGDQVFSMRANFGGAYYNSVFTDALYGVALGDANTRDRLRDGTLRLYNNIWGGFVNGDTPLDVTDGDAELADSLSSWANLFFDPVPCIDSERVAGTGTIDPRLQADLSSFSWVDPLGIDGYNPTNANVDFLAGNYQVVDYPGAFDPNAATIEDLWIAEWTGLYCGGWLGTNADCATSCCVGNAGDVNGDGNNANPVDLSYLVDFLFGGGAAPVCPEEGDINGDGSLANPVDLSFLVDFLFGGGAAPAPCL